MDEVIGGNTAGEGVFTSSITIRMFSTNELAVDVKERPLLGALLVEGIQTWDGNGEGMIHTVFEVDSVVLKDVPLGNLLTTATQSEGVKSLVGIHGATVLELGTVDGVSLYGKVKISGISFDRDREQYLGGISRDGEGPRLAITIGNLGPILTVVSRRKEYFIGPDVDSGVLANLTNLRIVAKVDGEPGQDTGWVGTQGEVIGGTINSGSALSAGTRRSLGAGLPKNLISGRRARSKS